MWPMRLTLRWELDHTYRCAYLVQIKRPSNPLRLWGWVQAQNHRNISKTRMFPINTSKQRNRNPHCWSASFSFTSLLFSSVLTVHYGCQQLFRIFPLWSRLQMHITISASPSYCPQPSSSWCPSWWALQWHTSDVHWNGPRSFSSCALPLGTLYIHVLVPMLSAMSGQWSGAECSLVYRAGRHLYQWHILLSHQVPRKD